MKWSENYNFKYNSGLLKVKAQVSVFKFEYFKKQNYFFNFMLILQSSIYKKYHIILWNYIYFLNLCLHFANTIHVCMSSYYWGRSFHFQFILSVSYSQRQKLLQFESSRLHSYFVVATNWYAEADPGGGGGGLCSLWISKKKK